MDKMSFEEYLINLLMIPLLNLSWEDLFIGKNVLINVAHADDELILFGALICKIISMANKVTIAVYSDLRSEHFIEVCEYLKCEPIIYKTDYSGKDIDRYSKKSIGDVFKFMRDAIERTNPDVIVTHGDFIDQEHWHPFHRMIHFISILVCPKNTHLVVRSVHGNLKAEYKKRALKAMQLYPNNAKWLPQMSLGREYMCLK